MRNPDIAYFITSHGFGHASRACAVMSCLQKHDPDLHFHIFSAVPQWFFEESGLKQISVYPIVCDIGLVQTSPFEIDFASTIDQLSLFDTQLQQTYREILEILKHRRLAAILCDVAVLGIRIAETLRVPSILIENFTWDWIYEFYAEEHPAFSVFVQPIRETIAQASLHYLTEPFCQYPRSLDGIARPIARTPRQSPGITREDLGISKHEKLVLFSLGGIPDQIQMNLPQGDQPKGITFLMPGIGNEIRKEGNTIFIPHHSSFYHPDLVAASDAVIAKVGYSTIAETYHAGIPMGFIPRPDFPESKCLSSYVREKMHGTEFHLNEFLSGHWLRKIEQMLETPPKFIPAPNGAEQIYTWLQKIMD